MNHLGFAFNRIRKEFIEIAYSEARPGISPVENVLIPVTRYPGAYVSETNIGVRRLSIPIIIYHEGYEDLQKKKEEIAEWLYHEEPKELVFDDEPEQIYYAKFDGELNFEEHRTVAFSTLEFICPDPFKYGPEKVVEPSSDTFIVENEGTAPTKPIFELTAKEPVTFAMISDGERYNMIGRPADVDEQVVPRKTTLLDERGDTIDQWDVAPGSTGSFVQGSLGIQVQSYGTGTGWHGPRLITEIDPTEDFEIEFYVNVRSETPERTFRISTNYYDENMNELGMLRLWDNSDRILRKVVEARVGPYVGDFINYPISSRNYDLRTQRVWNGLIRVTRINNIYFFYVARITQTGRHVDTLSTAFPDVNKEFAGPLKFVRIDIAKYGDTPPPNEVGITRIKVSKHHQVLVDQTPYIADVGDIFTFDHSTNELLLNGEDVKSMKDFGGEYFDLPKGYTALTILPEGAFDTKVRFRPRYK